MLNNNQFSDLIIKNFVVVYFHEYSGSSEEHLDPLKPRVRLSIRARRGINFKTLYTSPTVLSFHPTKTVCMFFIVPIRDTFLAHITLVNLIPVNIRWD